MLTNCAKNGTKVEKQAGNMSPFGMTLVHFVVVVVVVFVAAEAAVVKVTITLFIRLKKTLHVTLVM